ncbi:methyl-accepting chemotaxis protein [Devosia sp. 63-57]|uniref:methyl-accepting chemotaxis protein n=1 Tax=Devosia sp. 63-57 TaxID=1895751 RepID=UPI00086905B1|nr:methyl-accepting chemotaxis protein [Devosia sp. 63-57]ODT49002.1 MAG: hypothetical protein ABS74_10970 [Pelagibacterium sp. SCN 63-126]ODU82991.1 MAG: hypothetical protein ABT14_16330 [Pelagibacterium sp. SCN 63-17]OJX44067.1 MAG: hypothetical protein BGO80_00240 [Devosia sp. 63-57]
MSLLSKMNLSTKMTAISAIGMLFLAIMVTALFVMNNNAIRDTNRAMEAAATATDLVAAESYFRGVRIGSRDFRLATNSIQIASAQNNIDTNHAALIGVLADARARIQNEAEVEAIDATVQLVGSYMALVPQLRTVIERDIAAGNSGAFDAQEAAIQGEMSGFSEQARALLAEGVDTAKLTAEQMQAVAANASAIGQVTGAALGGLVILILIGSAVFARNAVVRPIQQITHAMIGIADGDFSVAIPHAGRTDEIGRMAGAVQVFKDNGIRVAALGEEEADRAQRALERAQMMERFQGEFDGAVSAAVKGDFSRRIEGSFADADVSRITTNFNMMLTRTEEALSEAGDVLAALAKTDLTQRMSGSYEGAFAKLGADTNLVADTLSDVVSRLRATSSTLRTATNEILTGANDLSERTTRQAAAIEETSAAMEQLTQAVEINARKAMDGYERSRGAAQLANEGGAVMKETTGAMGRISTSSAKVSDIIGMIDDIAFQTNLLALNASVEAARAGEAGKGFAVVAVEVRRLAQSAAQASSDVKALIDQSSIEVDAGSRLVATAAAKLDTILISVQENASLMHDISVANGEQSSAIAEIRQAVRQMDEMTQHNAALVEETNAAIEQTEAQARDLDTIVDIFKIAPAAVDSGSTRPKAKPSTGVRMVQAARAYISNGNAAISTDWNEF